MNKWVLIFEFISAFINGFPRMNSMDIKKDILNLSEDKIQKLVGFTGYQLSLGYSMLLIF